jgi:hypothetical protein
MLIVIFGLKNKHIAEQHAAASKIQRHAKKFINRRSEYLCACIRRHVHEQHNLCCVESSTNRFHLRTPRQR